MPPQMPTRRPPPPPVNVTTENKVLDNVRVSPVTKQKETKVNVEASPMGGKDEASCKVENKKSNHAPGEKQDTGPRSKIEDGISPKKESPILWRKGHKRTAEVLHFDKDVVSYASLIANRKSAMPLKPVSLKEKNASITQDKRNPILHIKTRGSSRATTKMPSVSEVSIRKTVAHTPVKKNQGRSWANSINVVSRIRAMTGTTPKTNKVNEKIDVRPIKYLSSAQDQPIAIKNSNKGSNSLQRRPAIRKASAPQLKHRYSRPSLQAFVSTPVVPSAKLAVAQRRGVSGPDKLVRRPTLKDIVSTSAVPTTIHPPDGSHPVLATLHQRPTLSDFVAGIEPNSPLSSLLRETPPPVPPIPERFANQISRISVPVAIGECSYYVTVNTNANSGLADTQATTPPVGNAFAGSGYWASSTGHSTPAALKVPQTPTSTRISSGKMYSNSTAVPSVVTLSPQQDDDASSLESLKKLAGFDSNESFGGKQLFPVFESLSDPDSVAAFKSVHKKLYFMYALGESLNVPMKKSPPPDAPAPAPAPTPAPAPWTRYGHQSTPKTPTKEVPNPQYYHGTGYQSNLGTPTKSTRPTLMQQTSTTFSKLRSKASLGKLRATKSRESLFHPAKPTQTFQTALDTSPSPKVFSVPDNGAEKKNNNEPEPPTLDKRYQKAFDSSLVVLSDFQKRLVENSRYHTFAELLHLWPNVFAQMLAHLDKEQAELIEQYSIRENIHLIDVDVWRFPIKSEDPVKVYDFETIFDRLREGLKHFHHEHKHHAIHAMYDEHRLIWATEFMVHTKQQLKEETQRHEERIKEFELKAHQELMNTPYDEQNQGAGEAGDNIAKAAIVSDGVDKESVESDDTITYENVLQSLRQSSQQARLEFECPAPTRETDAEAHKRRCNTALDMGLNSTHVVESQSSREELGTNVNQGSRQQGHAKYSTRVLSLRGEIASDWVEELDRALKKEKARQQDVISEL